MMTIVAQGSVMSYRDNYLSLDPNYKDAFGQPLLRVTFDWKENEFKMARHTVAQAERIARVLTDRVDVNLRKAGTHFDTRPYSHNGSMTSKSPTSSTLSAARGEIRRLPSTQMPCAKSVCPRNSGGSLRRTAENSLIARCTGIFSSEGWLRQTVAGDGRRH
jgi:hypothetical protein